MNYQPSLLAPPELFDVTIRDGSYVVDFQFAPEDVRLLFRAIDLMGFKYIEVGHGMGLNASAVKRAAASDDQYLTAARESCTNSKFGTFFIPGIGGREHLKRARETFGMHFVRVGNEPEKLESIFPFLEYARGLGYEVMANLMKSYTIAPSEFAKMAAALVRHGAQAVYVVDSAGGMLPDEVGDYVRAIREQVDVRVGFHGHNNLELAISNSISAWRNGASLIDCSIGGLGRSAGNTRTELLIPVLRAMGRTIPYDFHQVLAVWQDIIQPVLRRRPLRSVDVIGGYARIHSGLMRPFEEASVKHSISLEVLLDAYGNRLHAGTSVSIGELAVELGQAPRTSFVTDPKSLGRSLLEMPSPVANADSIRNTFRSVDEVLDAVRVLATKSILPVAALVSIVSETDDDPNVMAEYCYHDDHFIVIRLTFGSIGAFVTAMKQHRGCFDYLVLETGSRAMRNNVMAIESEWRRNETVWWCNLSAIKHHHLLSMLHHIGMEVGAKSVLFVGGNSERISEFILPHAEQFECYCTSLDLGALHHVGIRPLVDVGIAGGKPLPGKFDIAVLLCEVNGTELLAVLRKTAPTGALIDCVSQLGRHQDLLRATSCRTVSVSLARGLTGELLNLIQAQAQRRLQDADTTANLPGMPYATATRAA